MPAKEQILSEAQDIFRNVLDQDDLVIGETTASDEVEDWDSLNHIQLVVAIEKHFKIKFTSSQVFTWKNVGDMCNDIQKMIK
jgi:acyl carrier protein